MLYAPSLIQQGTMPIADILNADLEIPTLTQFNAEFNLKWQKKTHDKFSQSNGMENIDTIEH